MQMKADTALEDLKATIHESLIEHEAWFIEIFQDAIENDGLGKAIEEGIKGDYVSRAEVFATLQEEAEDIRAYDEAKAEEDEVIPFEQAIAEIESSNETEELTGTLSENDHLKNRLKHALSEALAERRSWLTSILHEVIEDYGMGKAMEEVIDSETVSEEEMLAALRNTD